MKKIFLSLFLLLILKIAEAQLSTNILKTDLNENGVVDIIKPLEDKFEIFLDNKKFFIPFRLLGFSSLEGISFTKKIFTIESGFEGTGMYNSIYKFRNNSKTKKMELIGYEYGFKWVTGNFHKSYNALTGNYEIILSEYNEKKDKFDEKKFNGIKAIEKINLNDITENKLKSLFKIGSEYEPK